MKINKKLLQINRNFLICFAVSASLTAIMSQMLSDHDNHINLTLTIIFEYVVYFGVFSGLMYLDNRQRYKSMSLKAIRTEIITLISCLGVGEILYLAIRIPTLYYFLGIEIEAVYSSGTTMMEFTRLAFAGYVCKKSKKSVYIPHSVYLKIKKHNLVLRGLQKWFIETCDKIDEFVDSDSNIISIAKKNII